MSAGTLPPAVDSSKPRVMVADDNPEVRLALCELLEGDGFEVVGRAIDGSEAVALAEELQPDVVLMDLRMPGLDGIEATRRIRDRHPLVQVVILTAYNDPALVEDANEAGVYCYLVKGSPPSLIFDVLTYAGTFKDGLEAPGRTDQAPKLPGLRGSDGEGT